MGTVYERSGLTTVTAHGIMIMVQSRDNDYEHYVKCGKCGWEGWSALMYHGYEACGQDDVEPVDFCPNCNTSESYASVFITCHRNCQKCHDRFVCMTTLTTIPIHDIGFFSKGEEWLKI